MASTKRLGSLDLRALLQTQAAQEVYMGQPRELTCWSRTSIREGMEYMFKDRAGLHPFVGLPVPGQANLMDGFPEAFVRKPSNEPTGVESIVRAVQQVGVLRGEHPPSSCHCHRMCMDGWVGFKTQSWLVCIAGTQCLSQHRPRYHSIHTILSPTETTSTKYSPRCVCVWGGCFTVGL